ncbi:MAG TPA: methylmalonyl Co-A mutase-associated GTPase MeaB, partial [Hyphomicrobiaceae bacterium]|nr:methylmalonyl Co-A mutase-associated GTPase MeaB [Hyphomicrobiaceae bacterium]
MPAGKPSSEASDLADLTQLVERMRAGERRAISRAVTELERLSAVAPRLLQAMQAHLGHALVVGFTGPPGAGKSTLVNAYTQHVRSRNKTVGIIAVDPSSPVSGGAILGDRVRMTATLDDDGVFMRSLASRGHLGGLSPAAVRVIDALDASGKDVILIETVGTGQSEIDVAEVADVRVLVTAPGLGDDIQAMKAGLIEIADVMVVNKSDREGAERTA